MLSETADGAQNLAILRIVVCAVVLGSADVHDAARWSAVPPDLRASVSGLTLPLAWLPVTPTFATVAYVALLGGALLGLVGLATRGALTVAAIAGTYLLGIPQLTGSVTHDHHVIWFLAILAASPCGDALSIDAARSPPPPEGGVRWPMSGRAYALPLWSARLLVAMIFFFPGVWKLRSSGWAWIASGNLRNQMYWKWYEYGGWTPVIRIDGFPVLCQVLAFAVVAFELFFVLFFLSRRLLPWAAILALVFHAGVELFMRMRFTSLWLCYVMFFDAAQMLRRFGAEFFTRTMTFEAPARSVAALRTFDLLERVAYRCNESAASSPPTLFRLMLRHPLGLLALAATCLPARVHRSAQRIWPSVVVGSFLLAGNAIFGAAGIHQAWPLACYPTFQWMAGEHIPHLAIDAVRADGSVTAIDSLPRSQKAWGIQWSVLGLVRGPVSQRRLVAYWSTAGSEQIRAREAGAVVVRFYRAWSSILPERYGDPPVRRELLYELPLSSRVPSDARGTSGIPRSRSGPLTLDSRERSASVKYSSVCIQPRGCATRSVTFG
jgi:hypothetical protein